MNAAQFQQVLNIPLSPPLKAKEQKGSRNHVETTVDERCLSSTVNLLLFICIG